MNYTSHFYDLYASYLEEKSVRAAHDWVFKIFNATTNYHAFDNVLDLGCGHHCEFLRDPMILSYRGMDLNAKGTNIKADYRTFDFKKLKNYTLFVSLFSSEITAPYKENYQLYERIFAEMPTIEAGLVSGFYYTDKKDQQPVDEGGDVISYQTLESIDDVVSPTFEERRIVLPVKSEMFGDNVIEVWKFLLRR